MGNVAVYWDFENMHASLAGVQYGPDWYRNNRFQRQPSILNIDAIMGFAAVLGNININRAYANWSNLTAYSSTLQSHAIDLIQLFPRGANSKNGADIRMAIEVIEDLGLNPHVDAIVVVGGDSDYIAVAQKVRQRGKRIIGIGVRESTNQYWIRSCDEFKFYTSLLVRSEGAAATTMPSGAVPRRATVAPVVPETPVMPSMPSAEDDKLELEDARHILVRAVATLGANAGVDAVVKAAIKPMMMRLDPSFDEANMGFRTFTDFLNACSDVIVIVRGESDHMVSLRGDALTAGSVARSSVELPYAMILRSQKVRLVDQDLLVSASEATYQVFVDQEAFPTWDAYENALAARLRGMGKSFREVDVNKLKSLFFKAAAVAVRQDVGGIGLAEWADSGDTVLKHVHVTLAKRILDNIQEEPDVSQLAEVVFGDESRAEEALALVEAYRRMFGGSVNGAGPPPG